MTNCAFSIQSNICYSSRWRGHVPWGYLGKNIAYPQRTIFWVLKDHIKASLMWLFDFVQMSEDKFDDTGGRIRTDNILSSSPSLDMFYSFYNVLVIFPILKDKPRLLQSRCFTSTQTEHFWVLDACVVIRLMKKKKNLIRSICDFCYFSIFTAWFLFDLNVILHHS